MIAGVVSVKHPLRALLVAVLLAAAVLLGLSVVEQLYRSDGAGADVTVTYDAPFADRGFGFSSD